MDAVKELLEKLEGAEYGVSHTDFEDGHPLSVESFFDETMEKIRNKKTGQVSLDLTGL